LQALLFGPITTGYFGDLAVTLGLRLTNRHRRQVRLTVVSRRARKNRASVRGGNRGDGGDDEGAHEYYDQDCNPDCTFHGFVSYFRFPRGVVT